MTLGTALPHVCHQRGLVPLHASAVVLQGKAYAFAGVSGIGKSTLLQCLIRLGYPFLSDDLCAVALPENDVEPTTAFALGPFVKLRDDTLQDYREAAIFKAVRGKSWVDQSARFHADPVSLAAVFLISDGEPADPVGIRRLTGVNVLRAAPALISRWFQARRSQDLATLVTRLTKLCRAAPVYVLRRPRSIDRLEETVAAIVLFAAGQEATA